MADVNLVRMEIDNRAKTGIVMPVMNSIFKSSETLTAGATAQLFADAGEVDRAELWIITVTGGNVRVAFGSAPVASPSTGMLLLPGRHEFSAMIGQKVSVIDA